MEKTESAPRKTSRILKYRTHLENRKAFRKIKKSQEKNCYFIFLIYGKKRGSRSRAKKSLAAEQHRGEGKDKR
ncbi:hypothetical protein AAAT88_08765 [Dialister hominis]